MKKSIGLVSLDSSLIKWLHEKLRISAPDMLGKAELLEGLEGLMDGTASSLMLELTNGQISVPTQDVIQCGTLTIYYKSRRVTKGDAEISLTPKEFDILYFLARNRGEVLQRNKFIKPYGKTITCWMTAISWPLSESCVKRLNQIQMHRSIF